jgi:hypothetical protein
MPGNCTEPFRRVNIASQRDALILSTHHWNRASILRPSDADRLPDPAPIRALGSAGPPAFDHDTRGGEPLDCGIVKPVLAQHFACVLREFGWR